MFRKIFVGVQSRAGGAASGIAAKYREERGQWGWKTMGWFFNFDF
jgi:hypothetical protein